MHTVACKGDLFQKYIGWNYLEPYQCEQTDLDCQWWLSNICDIKTGLWTQVLQPLAISKKHVAVSIIIDARDS